MVLFLLVNFVNILIYINLCIFIFKELREKSIGFLIVYKLCGVVCIDEIRYVFDSYKSVFFLEL